MGLVVYYCMGLFVCMGLDVYYCMGLVVSVAVCVAQAVSKNLRIEAECIALEKTLPKP